MLKAEAYHTDRMGTITLFYTTHSRTACARGLVIVHPQKLLCDGHASVVEEHTLRWLAQLLIYSIASHVKNEKRSPPESTGKKDRLAPPPPLFPPTPQKKKEFRPGLSQDWGLREKSAIMCNQTREDADSPSPTLTHDFCQCSCRPAITTAGSACTGAQPGSDTNPSQQRSGIGNKRASMNCLLPLTFRNPLLSHFNCQSSRGHTSSRLSL